MPIYAHILYFRYLDLYFGCLDLYLWAWTCIWVSELVCLVSGLVFVVPGLVCLVSGLVVLSSTVRINTQLWPYIHFYFCSWGAPPPRKEKSILFLELLTEADLLLYALT